MTIVIVLKYLNMVVDRKAERQKFVSQPEIPEDKQ